MKSGVWPRIALLASLMVVSTMSVAVSLAVGSTDDELLTLTLQGCLHSASLVTSSVGDIAVHEWYWRKNGELSETETTYDVKSKGNMFRASVERHFLKNELSLRRSDSGLRAISPGTVSKQEMAYDGQRVVSLKPAQKNRAVVGSMDSRLGHDLRDCLLTTLSPGHGVMIMTKDAGLPGYVRSGPRVTGRETLSGDECIVIEMTETNTTSSEASVRYIYLYRSWINPQKGYTLAKSQCWMEGGKLTDKVLLAEANIEVREYGNGIWGISKAVSEQHALDPDTGRAYLQIRRVTTFDPTYQLNAPISEDEFSIKLPTGMKVYDESLDAQYTVP